LAFSAVSLSRQFSTVGGEEESRAESKSQSQPTTVSTKDLPDDVLQPTPMKPLPPRTSTGNQVRLFFSGDDTYSSVLHDIEHAQRSIAIDMYLWELDNTGTKVLEAVRAAAARGVQVVVLIDQFGSPGLCMSLSRLTGDLPPGARVEAHIFNPVLDWPWRMRAWSTVANTPFFRNHRKIIIIDNAIAYVGGMNIADDHTPESFGGNGLFRDTHARVTGPAVQHLAAVAADTLAIVKGERRRQPPRERGKTLVSGLADFRRWSQAVSAADDTPTPTDSGDGAMLQVLESNAFVQRTQIQRALRQAIRASHHECHVTTPYFVPPLSLKRAFVAAARRGVSVIVLTQGKTDVRFMNAARQHALRAYLRAGVRVFELQSQALHAKTVTIDGAFACIGSFNMDYQSVYRNLEVSVATIDRGIVRQLDEQLQRDLAQSTEITLDDLSRRSWLQRFVHWAAFLAIRFIKHLH
jgi:cardiolipin synthase